MTEGEILQAFLRADKFLAQYKSTVMPAAEALARLKEQEVGVPYEGQLGCYEEGADTVCLHVTDQGRDMHSTESEGRARKFDFHWDDKLTEAGVRHISLSGFY